MTRHDEPAEGDVAGVAARHWVPDGEAQCYPCHDGTRVGVCDQRGCQCECRYATERAQ